ncbi:MAG: hypothetical protein JXO72_15310 [Vicinamibacteria bacterium]|nr:hypothetical protein [Vicinamibacteria bacterium]
MSSPCRGRVLAGSALVISLALTSPLYAEWGVHLGGNLGSAPSFARTAFDSEEEGFKFDARGIEVGFVKNGVEVDFFMDTIRKGYINRGYVSRRCVTVGAETECFPEGTYLDPAGVRLIGVRAGSFLELRRFSEWARLGVPFHIGMAFFTGEALRVDSTINYVASDPADPQSSLGVVARTESIKVQGKQIMNGGRSPFPVFDFGLALRVRTASWAEAEVGVRVHDFRFPALAWGMVFGKSE